MVSFALRRLAQAVPTVFLSTVAVFLLLRVLPGDPAQVLAGPDAPRESVEAIRDSLGLDQPLPIQYVVWLGRVVRGDLGISILSRIPVAQLIGQRLPATLELTTAAMLLTIAAGLPLGIFAALHPRGWTSWLVSSFSAVALALPNFWLGILAIILFSLVLGWLPPGGRVDFARDAGQALRSLALPSITLSLLPIAALSRLARASMLEVLHEDYIRTAQAKGVGRTGVVIRHALRNALIPIVTILALLFGRLLGGAVVVESVFAWPGVGTLLLTAIGNRDYAIVQSALLLLVMAVLVVNLLTDLTYGLLDPRTRSRSGTA
ncbi:MAG: ABC transporter permease [Chloroflexi bacterium]|nr:ABC transporter permease [Chloroflexota bacterium]